jgi:hypothetical protein
MKVLRTVLLTQSGSRDFTWQLITGYSEYSVLRVCLDEYPMYVDYEYAYNGALGK